MVSKLSQNVRDTVNKTPNGVLLICGTVLFCILIGSFTLLAWGGKDATELRALINTILNIAGVIFGGGAFLYSGMAAKRSDEAANNTNGKLQEVVKTAIHTAVQTAVNGEGDNDGRPPV